jgi:hypothetical protein
MRVVAVGGLQHDDLTRWCLRTHLSTCEAKTASDTMVMQHVWSQIEPATAIICVSVSTYRPLFEDWKKRTARVSGPFRASPRRQLQQNTEGLNHGMFVNHHTIGNRGFSGRQTDGMFV